MCGHFGFISKFPKVKTKNRRQWFRTMLQWDTVRGEDSTGMYLKDGNKTFFYKRALDGFDFSKLAIVPRQLLMLDPTIAMGHNRAATKGLVDDSNAHPFIEGSIIMTHNGTLENFFSLKEQNETDITVDSRLICKRISEGRFEEFAAKAEGAFSLAWYDTETNKFHLFNNGKRSLAYAISEDKDSMYYASEGDMLSTVAWREALPLLDNAWYELEHGILYTFDPSNPAEFETEKIQLKKPEKGHAGTGTGRTTSNYKAPVVIDNSKKPTFKILLNKIGLDFNQDLRLMWINSHESGVRFTHEFKLLNQEGIYIKHPSLKVFYRCQSEDEMYDLIASADNVFTARPDAAVELQQGENYILYLRDVLPTKQRVPDEEYEAVGGVAGPGGLILPKGVFLEKVKNGCAYCPNDISLEEAQDIEWDSAGNPLCVSCSFDYRGQQIH